MPTIAPSDIARLGHRYQVRAEHLTSARVLVASRIQRIDPTINRQTEVYNELGSVDPVGEASEAPEFRVALEEYVHNSELDLLLAGKSAVATSWNAADYINDGKLNVYILERDNDGNIEGEVEFTTGVLSEIQWSWQMGQPIMGRYTIDAKLGRRWAAAYAPHTWGTQDTTSQGGIRVKDARLFLGGIAAANRIFRLQSMTLRVTYRSTAVREVGSRALVGWVVEPPQSTLDIDILAADHQPDDILFTEVSSQYYDYVNPVSLTNSAIKIYDPDAGEAASVLRSWKLENLKPATASPLTAQVRGLATKRYSFVLHKATTANTGGILCYTTDLS